MKTKDAFIFREPIIGVNSLWASLCKRYKLKGLKRYFFALIIFAFLFFAYQIVTSYVQAFVTKKVNGVEGLGDNPKAKPSITAIPTSSNYLIEDNCYTEWIDFSSNYWDGLNSGFEMVNGVYTIPDSKRKVDSVAYYKKSCVGGVKAEVEYITYSKYLMNINLYYGNWFRWEIGGRDLNSIKLYKNEEGCTAFKNARPVKTQQNKYLFDGEKMLSGEPIVVTMLIYLTESGKLRTELHVEFTSQKSGKRIMDSNSFYYEFDVSWYCDENTVLDIDKDSARIGVGLMRSSIGGDELPRVKFQRFRVEKYSNATH